MNPSEIFIKRPITTTLIVLGVMVFGVMAYQALPISDLPDIEFPTIQVSANLPGASPETMASAVALPLEKQIGSIPGLTSINSTNTQGATRITLQFELSRDIDAAAQDVQAMIAKAARQLPAQMPAPPSYQKVNPNDEAVLVLALGSDTQVLSLVDEYAETTIAQRLSTVDGVALVTIIGQAKYAVRVDLDPSKLAAHQIGIDEVANAVSNANVTLPTGTIWGADHAYSVLANGQLLHADAYKPTIVAYRNGNPVRLDSVANVYDGIENDKAISWYNGRRPAVYLQIMKQPGANVVAVCDTIKALLPTFRAELPPSISLDLRADRSVLIRQSVHDVKFTLILTIGLVVMVIFLFLRKLSVTIIPSLALPASILTTFAAMYLLGYSLDNLSLLALTLSVGFVVDDAIVMVENIVRHMEMGKSAMRAALEGSKEIAFTIVSMTVSLTAVFIPVLFMGGVVGRLLREFSVTIGVAILVSGFVSISLTPMLCSRFLRPTDSEKHGWLYSSIERVFDSWLRLYDKTLQASLRYRAATMAISVGLLVGTVYMFMKIPQGFLPLEDGGRVTITDEALQGISFDDMVQHQLALGDIVNADPNVSAVNNMVGSRNTFNQGAFSIDLKPLHDRKPIDEVIAGLRAKLAAVPGMRIFLQNPPSVNLGGQSGARALYQFTLQDTDTAALYHWAPIMEQKMAQIPGLQDVSSDLQIKNPQVNLDIDRDKVGALGLTMNQVETALYSAYGTRQVSTIYAPNNQYQVIMQVAPKFQEDPAALSQLYVRSSAGRLIPLNTVAKVSTDTGPLVVTHTAQLPSVTISFGLKPGTIALGDAVSQIRKIAADVLPASMTTTFQGAAKAFQDSVRGLGLILLMAVVVIYIVLGILYESFTHPLTILSGLPSAGFGALLTLMIFKTELSLYAFVGVIMLVGLVKKNGIMMVDFAVQAQRDAGKTPLEAIHEACLVRFRPIMMTTMAALVGTLPIATGWGAGSESRRPLGLVVVGGLLTSQLLTLYITPVYYVYIEHARMWLTDRKRKHARQGDDAMLPELPVGLQKGHGA